MASWLAKLKDGLARTREGLMGRLHEVVQGRRIDEALYEDLEEALLRADVGVATTMALLQRVRQRVKDTRAREAEAILAFLRDEAAALLKEQECGLQLPEGQLGVILVVGVNGVGKTTTIGKLAFQLKAQGRKVLLAAGDTFRAAAVEQLGIWAKRAGVEMVHHGQGADPAAVMYDAVQAARARGVTVLIADTAGRLHNRVNLMEELKKIVRVLGREVSGAPHEVLLVLDATTGQNGLQQAKLFTETAGVTGIVLTKLDGTAKGGIVLAIARELNVPVKFVGLGEGMDDLRPFAAEPFVEALFAIDSKEAGR